MENKKRYNKAEIIETWRNEPSHIGGNRRIWIVKHGLLKGNQKECSSKKEAKDLKEYLDNLSLPK